jgi:hypothetical protein
MSSNGRANMSCSTNASRSAGCSVSSTTSSARPTESAISASSSGSPIGETIGSGSTESSGSSRRARRERSMFRLIRATTVVSHARRSRIVPGSERSTRSQASCTASSASVIEPSMR